MADVPATPRRIEGGLRARGVVKESRPGRPLVTIITAVRNGGTHLRETIESVAGQSYENIEYIVIDGASDDGSVDVLRDVDDAIDYWVSEPDGGIADAFNKGVRLARGDWINFQGAGDGFATPDSVRTIVEAANGDTSAIVCGEVQRVDLDDAPLYRFRLPRKFDKRSLLLRMSLPHQGLFAPRKMFDRYGLFDTSNVFAMDYEHLLRAYRDFPDVVLVREAIARWRAGGIGTGRAAEIFREYDRIKRINRVAPAAVLTMIDSWIRLKYRMKTILGRFVPRFSE